MKIDVYDIEKVYKSFFEMQQNQIEIFQQLRSAVSDYATLESFKGLTAESAKAYMSDVHISVVDSIELALMELEIRLLTLKQDFNATVDESESAVVDEAYIGQTIENLGGYIESADTHDTDVTALISSVSDIISLTDPSIPDYVDLMTTAKTDAEDTLTKLLDFDDRHKADMDNVNDMFTAIASAVQFMASTENIGKYTADSSSETEWSKLLYTCQVKAYLFSSAADPDFADTIYVEFAIQTGLTMLDALIPADADIATVLGIVDKITDGYDVFDLTKNVSVATREALQIINFFRDGLRFVAQVDSSGETVIRVASVAGKILTRSQQVVALRAAGIADDVGRATARSLASSLFSANGLQITGSNAYQLKGGAIDTKSITALTQAINAGDDATSFAKLFAKGLKKVSGLEWVLYGVTIVVDVADSFYDERTRKLAEFDFAELTSDVIVDTASFLAPIAASAAAGAAWGTVVPGIGNLVGAGVGIIVGAANLITWGEPPKSLTDHASDWIEGTINDVGNWLSKVFW